MKFCPICELPIIPSCGCKVIQDAPTDTRREVIVSLLKHAREDARLAEFTAQNGGYKYTADDCHNIGIAIEKSLASQIG